MNPDDIREGTMVGILDPADTNIILEERKVKSTPFWDTDNKRKVFCVGIHEPVPVAGLVPAIGERDNTFVRVKDHKQAACYGCFLNYTSYTGSTFQLQDSWEFWNVPCKRSGEEKNIMAPWRCNDRCANWKHPWELTEAPPVDVTLPPQSGIDRQ